MPLRRTLTYSVADLQQYVDQMTDISLMVADPQTKQYAPKVCVGVVQAHPHTARERPHLHGLSSDCHAHMPSPCATWRMHTDVVMAYACCPSSQGKAFLKSMLLSRLKSAAA